MSPAMITVVIHAGHAYPCLAQARERVPRQMHTTIGILVVDDGSADYCGEVAQDHLDSRISVVRQRIAGPAAGVRNGASGIERARRARRAARFSKRLRAATAEEALS
jgi:hypothetical protein